MSATLSSWYKGWASLFLIASRKLISSTHHWEQSIIAVQSRLPIKLSHECKSMCLRTAEQCQNKHYTSQRSCKQNGTLTFWLLVYITCSTMDSNGEIVGALYGCPAGADFSGRCKHIATFTFALEEYCSIRELRSPQSCTSVLQKWNQPHKRKVYSRRYPLHQTWVQEDKKVAPSVFYDPCPPNLCSTSYSSIQVLNLPSALATASSSSALELPPPPPFLRDKYSKHLNLSSWLLLRLDWNS